MITIIPTVLAYSEKEFRELWKKILPIADEIQVDIMDGRFVSTKSIDIEELPNVQGLNKRFEAHMMIKEPMSWVLPLADKGFRRMIIHYEAITDEDVPLINTFMEQHGLLWCLAFNPETPVLKIIPHTKIVNDILIMGVHPGQNNAPYVEKTPDRVRELRKHAPHVTIQIDGGMTDKTIGAVVRAGATRINSGSFVGGAKHPIEALERMYKAAGVNP